MLTDARASAHRAVNAAMVHAYWRIGQLIVLHEQGGQRRAAYGDAVLDDLARRLTADLGRGFDVRNLRYMRQFYLAFPIEASAPSKRNALRSESRSRAKRNALRSESRSREQAVPATLRPELSWTHYRLLLGVEAPAARAWYLQEAADQHWSTRQLERQISVLYYDRLMATRTAGPVRREASKTLATVAPAHFIRDPYVLEFLELPDHPALRESVLEQAIVDNLQAFLLELGKGFSFVARQRRLRFEDEDFYVDLVFYNYLLRCFVLIDLKVGKLTHQDIGQMESYVRMFDAHERPPGDNPTIGLVLCSQKNEAIARYSVLSEARQIFAAKYIKILPTEHQLTRAIKRERRLIEAGRSPAPRGGAVS